MANGDAAAAVGMDVVPATADLRDGYDEINKTRDYIAADRTRVASIAAGGTGAATAADARRNLGIASYNVPSNGVNNDLGGTSNLQRDIEYLNDQAEAAYGRGSQGVNAAADAWNRAGDAIGFADQALRGNLYQDSYNRSVSGQSVKVAYLGNTGQLGFSSSSETVKQDIEAFDVPDAVLALVQLVTYRYRAQGDDGPLEAGVIAERLIDAGLGWLTFADDEGNPQGVHYERLALALLPAVQRLMTSRDDLERRLSALEQQKGAE